MNKKCLLSTTILVLIIVAGFYKFIIEGTTNKSTDGRIEILLTEGERNLVLTEMRAFLSSVQQINQGLANEDMASVIEAARHSGKAAQAAVPGTLIGKLPIAFKKLGGDTHAKFDQLAMDAGDLSDTEHTLEQLSTLMKNCVSCHEAYRFSL